MFFPGARFRDELSLLLAQVDALGPGVQEQCRGLRIRDLLGPGSFRYTCSSMFIAALLKIARNWKQPTCLLTSQ